MNDPIPEKLRKSEGALGVECSDLLDLFKICEPDLAEYVLWAWMPIKEEHDKWDDCASGYVIAAIQNGCSGLVLFAQYGTSFMANPHSTRPVLRRMLNQCGGEIYGSNAKQSRDADLKRPT